MKIENKISLILNELFTSETENKVKEILKKECKPFINDLKKIVGVALLYSGRGSTTDPYFIKSVRKNRKPSGTPLYIHTLLDNEFKKHFGYNYRSAALFVTSDLAQATYYGNIYAIFPMGKYEIVWSPKFYDLFTDLDTMVAPASLDTTPVAQILRIANVNFNYIEGDLKKAILSKNEIMVKCDNYVAVRVSSGSRSPNGQMTPNEISEMIKDL